MVPVACTWNWPAVTVAEFIVTGASGFTVMANVRLAVSGGVLPSETTTCNEFEVPALATGGRH